MPFIDSFSKNRLCPEKTITKINHEHKNCDATGRKSYFYANMCEIRRCVVEKKRRSCSGCSEYPCDKLNAFLKSAPEGQAKAMQNLLETIAEVEQSMHSVF